MNNKRREVIRKLIAKTEQLKAEVEKVHNEEEDAFDAMGDGLQNTLRGMRSEDAVDSLDEAVELFDEIIDSLNNAAL